MVMSAYFKTILRTFKSNITRFIAITSIIALGICFVSGIGALSPKILDTFDESLAEHNAHDILIKSKSTTGFDNEVLWTLNSVEGMKIQPFFSMDADIEGKNTRVVLTEFGSDAITRHDLIEGKLPSNNKECVVERPSDTLEKIEIGEKINFMGYSVKVTGIVANPMYFARDGEINIINNEPLARIVYADADKFVIPNMPVTDIYVKIVDNKQSVFSSAYERDVAALVERLRAMDGLDGDSAAFLTHKETKSTAILKSTTDKIDIICIIFPIFFILVVALVVLTTMSRLIEEERNSLACYKTLGFSNFKILAKYLLFAIICCALGIIIGIAIGIFLLPSVICPAFDGIFFLPELTAVVNANMGIYSSIGMLVAVLLVAYYVAMKELKEKPAELLRHKSPKAGKKVFLERIPLIWNRLSFKHKSTFRNIFRYVGKLLMVVISVAGSSALIMAGLGLLNVASGSTEIAGILAGMTDTIVLISNVIIMFAIALCILVIYNLTNMSISERKREIATLKVLGYRNTEVCGYIFREIFVMAVFGVIIGVPLGAGVLAFLFAYLEFGTMAGVQWYSYLITAVIVLATVGIVCLALTPKIIKQDMNNSLKAVE